MCTHRRLSYRPKRGVRKTFALAVCCLAVLLLCFSFVLSAAASDMVGISGEIRMLVTTPEERSGEVTIGYRFAGGVKASGRDSFQTAVSLEEAWMQGFVFPELTGFAPERQGFVEDADFVEAFHCSLLVDVSLVLQVDTHAVLSLPELSRGSAPCLAAHHLEGLGGIVLDLGPIAPEFAESLRHGAPKSYQQAVFAVENAIITVLLTTGGKPKVPMVGERHVVEYRRVVLRVYPHPASRPTAEMEYGDEYTVLSVWADPDGVYWVETDTGWLRKGSPDLPWF